MQIALSVSSCAQDTASLIKTAVGSRGFFHKRESWCTCSRLGDSPSRVWEGILVGEATLSAQTSAAKGGSLSYRMGDRAKELSANVALRERKGKESNCFVLVLLSNSRNSVRVIKRKISTTIAPRIPWVARSWHNSQEIRNEKLLKTEYYELSLKLKLLSLNFYQVYDW